MVNENSIIKLLQFASELISKPEHDQSDLKKILEQFALYTNSDSGRIMFYNPQKNKLQEILNCKYEKSIDLELDNSTDEALKETKSLVAVPILHNSRAIGVLSLMSRKIIDYKERTETLMAVTRILSTTIQKIFEKSLQIDFDEKKEIAFVLMPFHEPFNKYYQSIIKPVIELAGLKSLRSDEIYGPSNIIKDIWTSIINAKVVLAELTTRNPNVMYELGICHAIGKPVILFAQSVNDVPFDLRSLRCVIYGTIDPDWATKLRENLAASIRLIAELPTARITDFLPFHISFENLKQANDLKT